MKSIINETEKIADEYLKNFGFSDEQVDTLINLGKKDLDKELGKLKTHLDAGSVEDINNSLHALKGLFFQLGNHQVAERLDEIREDETNIRLQEISELLFT